MNLKLLYQKNKETIAYLFFGACATIVYFFTYWISTRILSIGILFSTSIAWFITVMFAYITNKNWVFQSKTTGFIETIKQMSYFFISRIATLAIDEIFSYVFIKYLHFTDLPTKIAIQILIIILNYIASKLIIFK